MTQLKEYFLGKHNSFREGAISKIEESKDFTSNNIQLENMRISNINFNRNGLRDNFIKKFIIETAFESLPIDEPDKDMNEDTIKASMEETLDEFFNVNNLIKSTNRTTFQQKMLVLGENFADDKVADGIEKGLEPIQVKEFNDEDKIKVLHSVKSANGDTKIVEKIQNNVIKAVTNEEKIAEEKVKQEEKIEDKVNSNLGRESETDEQVNESTLLKAITIAKGKEVLKEGADPKNILAEALITYTLLETLYTMKLVEFSPYSLRKVKDSFINKRF